MANGLEQWGLLIWSNMIISVARQMQNDLAAYDYSNIAPEDLFGPLVAQLAEKDRRLLLGQEYTPQWVAQKMVAHAIELLPETGFPNFVDMCCGSGVFVVETINQTIARYQIVPAKCSVDLLRQLTNSIVGFDIDPLAVMLSKLNWAMAMRAFVPHAAADFITRVFPACARANANVKQEKRTRRESARQVIMITKRARATTTGHPRKKQPRHRDEKGRHRRHEEKTT